MPEKKRYIMVCAPSGTGLRSAIEKIKENLTDVEVQDVEDTLCNSYKATVALEKVGVARPPGVSDWPAMYDITWNLSRSQILELWKDAVLQALHRLASSDRNVNILSCHLIYYGGRRDEFYTPINASCLENANIKPSHILLLIDDVYDMYLRLSSEKVLFDPKDRIPSLHGRIREEEGVEVEDLQPDQLVSLSLIWQIRTLELLLSWRHLEMVLAEKLATHLQASFWYGV
jgi:hypothetical protein